MNTTQTTVTIASAITADDLLTALANVKRENRSTSLGVCGIRILREAADLCGVDSVDMGKRSCIKAIIENF
jgi:hypothetical protein